MNLRQCVFVASGLVAGLTPSNAAPVVPDPPQHLTGLAHPSSSPIAIGLDAGANSYPTRQSNRPLKVERQGLEPSQEAVNRDRGFLNTSGWIVLVVSTAIIGQAVLIGALLVQRRRLQRAERALLGRQDALLQSQSRYSMATAAGAVGVWDWNLETNEIYVDPTLKSILAFEHAESSISSEVWGSRVHVEDLAVVTAQVQACIDGKRDDYEIEHRMTHADGSVRWFLSRGSVLRRPDNTPYRMVGTKVDITERKRAEETLRESAAALRASHQQVHDLAGRLIAAQEYERARIARELHDDTSQQLAALSIALSSVRRRIASLPGAGDVTGEVSAVQRRTIALAEDLRHLSHDLHPSVISHAGLVAALTHYCAEVQRRQGLTVTFFAEGDYQALGADAALCLYRVTQEAVRNVVTHASAQRAEVRLTRSGDDVELTIVDDGRGFDIAQAARSIKGLGLVSIQERVRLAGGSVGVLTAVNKGTRVRVSVPAHRGVSTAAAGGPGAYASSPDSAPV